MFDDVKIPKIERFFIFLKLNMVCVKIFSEYCNEFMNRIVYILLVLGVTLCSCDDYFSTESDSTYTEKLVFSNVDLAEQAVVGIYSNMCDDNLYSKKLSMYFSMNTDAEYISGETDNGRRGVARYVATSSNTELYAVWTSLYQAIERANLCISGIRSSNVLIDGGSQQKNKMRRLLGESLTLRAILYFDLVKNFGDVPLKREPSEFSQSLILPKTSRAEILDGLIEDLTEAKELLPWFSELGTSERVHKGFVKGLLARVALFRAGCGMNENNEKPHDRMAYYEIANRECKDIVESSQHALNPSFELIFRTQCQYEKDLTHGESMFELAFGKLNRGELGYYIGVKHEENAKYGKSEAGMYAPPSFFYSYDTADCRRDVTCAVYKYTSDGVQSLTNITAVTLAKWRKEWIKPAVTGSAKYTGVNYTFMRFSDVLLMLAETENELNDGPTDIAKNALKEVRKRAFNVSSQKVKVHDYVDSLNSKDLFFNALVDERAWEFAGEGVRKYDLIRWGLLADKIEKCKADLVKIQTEEPPFENVPQKVYWKLSDDGETIEIANIDKLYVGDDFDVKTASNSKWKSKLSTSYIDRVAEANPDQNRFLPIPQKAQELIKN